jgi:hypothetical protein
MLMIGVAFSVPGLEPTLTDSVERRAVSFARPAGTRIVIVSFPAGQHLLQRLLAWLGGLPVPNSTPPSLSKFQSPASGSFRTELGVAARRPIPIRCWAVYLSVVACRNTALQKPIKAGGDAL